MKLFKFENFAETFNISNVTICAPTIVDALKHFIDEQCNFTETDETDEIIFDSELLQYFVTALNNFEYTQTETDETESKIVYSEYC